MALWNYGTNGNTSARVNIFTHVFPKWRSGKLTKILSNIFTTLRTRILMYKISAMSANALGPDIWVNRSSLSHTK